MILLEFLLLLRKNAKEPGSRHAAQGAKENVLSLMENT